MTGRVTSSFRDPSGFIFEYEGVLYRQVNRAHQSDFDALILSGLYDALVDRGLLIPHVPADVPAPHPETNYLVIRPEPVSFISYPFEWCPSQLRAAALATLEIQRLAIEHGMSLRDATAYNIQFRNGQPVLIDTLSFERLPEDRPWVAYGQFCRHFLAPLALMRHVDVRLGQLARTYIDGVPLDLASKLLPWWTRLQFGLGVHLHAHAASQARHGRRRGQAKRRQLSRRALLGLIDSLTSVTRRQTWDPAPSTWRDYYAIGESYTDVSATHKREIVRRVLSEWPAGVIWDLGANTGEFSRLADTVTGAEVLAIEADVSAVELNWRSCQREDRGRVTPLLIDLANPTPSQGWAHEERASLQQRGPADVVLALALVHHLAIGNNVPLQSLLTWLAALGRTVILEWVPKEDPMVQHLLSSREDVFSSYSSDELEYSAKELFSITLKEKIKDSSRYIYVLEQR
jgi:hypothetical protein